MDEKVQCANSGCLKPPTAIFGGKFYCRGHFVAVCYERLDFCADLLSTRNFTDRISQEMCKFIAECTEQATRLSETAKIPNNIERARLLDILFYASDIGRHLRRSPRKALSIPVRVLCKTPAREWQEDTLTRSISRFGGMLECQHTIMPDDVLSVEHLDSGRVESARLAWGWRARSGTFVFALEFVNCSNFWELDWSEPPANSADSPPDAALPDIPKDSPQ
jgi:hypothetical protein